MDIELRNLEIFCRVVELRSFSRAAEEVFLTQPTVSGRIAALERQVGAALLDRLGREVVPTQAGMILYRHARELLAYHRAAMQELSEFLGGLRGSLLLGGSTIPGEYLLPGRIAQFKAQHPGITIRLKIADSAEIIERVAGGELELGAVGTREEQADLHFAPFDQDQLVLAVPPDHRWASQGEIRLEELLSEPFIAREIGSGTRRTFEQALRGQGIEPRRDLQVVCELGSTEAVKRCIEAGAGVGIVSDRALQHELQHGLLKKVALQGLQLTRLFYLVTPSQRTLSPIASAFYRFLCPRETFSGKNPC